MSGKRPTDHLEPAAKKRGADRDINKDNYEEEDDEEVEAGSFQRADAEVLKQRKIIKARRNPAAATTTIPNPFANINLAPTGGATTAPPANPFAPTTLVAPPKPEDKKEEEVKEQPTTTTNGEAATATEDEKKEEENPAQQQPSTKPSSGFGAFTASSGGLLFGGGKSTGGFGGFGGDAAAGSAPTGGGAGIFGFGSASTTAAAGAAPSVFGSTQPVGFGALSSAGTGSDGTTGGTISIFVGGGATTTSIAAATAGGPATGEGEGEEEERKKEEAPAPAAPAPSNVFGATTTTNTTSALPEEQPAATGEEREDVVYSVDGVLFEFDLVEKTWKERGRGEARVLVHRNTSAGRVVMRQKGNLRLLLNANLWKEMHLNRMDGGKGVTFAVINHALVGEGQENGGGGAPLATYAFRVKTEDLLENFIEAVDSHKGGRLVNV